MKTKRKMTERRVLSFLLSMALFISVLPVSRGQVAKAAEGYPVTYEVKTDEDGLEYIAITGLTDDYTNFIVEDTLTFPDEIEGKPVKEIAGNLNIEAKNVIFPNTLETVDRGLRIRIYTNTEKIYFMCSGIFTKGRAVGTAIFNFFNNDGTFLKDVYFYPYEYEADADEIMYLGNNSGWEKVKNPITLHLASPVLFQKLMASENAKKQIDAGRLIVVQDLEVDYDSKLILPSVIEKAEAYTEESDYSKASWAALQTALANAKAVTEETDAEEARRALDSLQDALAGMAFVGNLNAAIASAEGLTGAEYTDSTWSVVASALEAAQNAGDNVTTEEAAALAKTLEDAVAALVKKTSGFLRFFCKDVVFPAVPAPYVTDTTNVSAKVTYEYFTDQACENPVNAEDPSQPPTEPGTYYVQGTVAATENRLSATSSMSFTIHARSGEGYSLSDDGVLTITDTAALESDQGNPPWYGVNPEVLSVELASGVEPTKIGANRFRECEKLTAFTVPDTVTSLGENCFFRCYELAEITIPDGVTSLGNGCFWETRALTEISLPDTVTSLGEDCFYQDFKYTDQGLSKIIIPDSVTAIGDGCFSGNGRLKEVTLPTSLKSIGATAFRACESLHVLKIPETLETLGGGAFYGSGIRRLVIPESVTAVGGERFYGLFEGCTQLSCVVFRGTEYTADDLGGIYNMFLGVPDDAAVLCDGTTYETLHSYSETLDSDHKWPENILRKPQEYATEQQTVFQEEKQAVSGLIETDYTTETWSALQAALAHANELSEANGTDFDKVVGLMEARNTLAEGTMLCLEEIAAQTKELLAGENTEKDYDTDDDNWWNLQDALEDAEKLVKQGTVDAIEIVAGIQAVRSGFAGLSLKSTDNAKKALNEAVAAAGALIGTDYTPDSWKALQNVLAEAEKASGKNSQLEALQKKVEDAVAALVKMPTDTAKTALETAMAAATKDLKESDYTPDSWKVLQDALTEAETWKENGTISQIQAAQKKVEDAVKALVKKGAEPSTKPSANPSGNPSGSPSANPSAGPSGNPGVSPSSNPGGSPSSNPSAGPSGNPGVSPSSNPGGSPNVSPSSNPSGNSNVKPSTAPGTKLDTGISAPKVKKAAVKKVKSTKKKTIQVQWKKMSGVTGYQVQTALDKKFKKAKKTYSVKKAATTKKTIKKMKSKKKYFVRVRAYKTLNGKKYYGSWSKIKSVKVK